jgi:tyrosine-protein phosphatase SIW14
MKYITQHMRAAALLFMCAASAHAQEATRYRELPNLYQVNAQLYRGGQPDRGSLALLARLGVKTIINLRGADERTRAEEQEASALGLRYYNVPLPSLSRPDAATVERVLALIADAEAQPVFVHCKRGSDRTGTIIACYRIRHDGWTAQAALAEARRFGLSRFERGMKHFIEDYARRRAAASTVINTNKRARAHWSLRLLSS